MSNGKTGNVTHDNNVAVAESTRQVAVAAASTQAAANTAAIAFYRAVIASAKINGITFAQDVRALQELGTGGT